MKRALLLPLVLVACAAEPPPAPVAPPPVVPPPTAVAAPPVRVTPDAPFRAEPPAAGPDVTFVPPEIQSASLKNGIRVLFVERHDLPIVSLRVVEKDGAGDFPAEPPGLLSFMGSMLEQGTATKSALEISDAFESLGAIHNAWVDWDSGGASLRVLPNKLDAALALLGDVVLHPSFPDAEIERLKARRLSAIQQERNSVQAMGSNATSAILFGRASPYGHSLSGREQDLAKVTRPALVKAHDLVFTPSRTAIVVAGDVTREDLLRKLEATFGGWRGAASPASPPKPPVKPIDAARVIWVDKPGAPQSVVRLAEVGLPRLAPDRDAVSVMNTIFGGMFSSRINLNLREKNAYTYGAGSTFHMRHGAGPFTVGGNIVADKTAPAIAEIFGELRRMRDEPVTEKDLENAKENIKRAMPGRFETVTEVTGALSDIAVYGLPLDEYATRPARIDKITADDVIKASKAHLHLDAIKIIVVGDRKKLESSLETLHLGVVEQLDAYGDPVTSSASP
jgi:zinc protease